MLLWNKKRKKRVVKNVMAVCVALQPLQLEVQAELQVHCDVADKRRAPSFFISSSTQTNDEHECIEKEFLSSLFEILPEAWNFLLA